MPNRVVVQWDKEDCADMGIVKIDLLGLGMMAVLKDCLALIRDHWREEIDLGKFPENDALVYQTLQKGDTIGMFQVESRAQMATLLRLKPENFYDLMVEVAHIRPGPIVGEMVHPYLARRAGKEKIVPLHPLLEPVLARTLGVPSRATAPHGDDHCEFHGGRGGRTPKGDGIQTSRVEDARH